MVTDWLLAQTGRSDEHLDRCWQAAPFLMNIFLSRKVPQGRSRGTWHAICHQSCGDWSRSAIRHCGRHAKRRACDANGQRAFDVAARQSQHIVKAASRSAGFERRLCEKRNLTPLRQQCAIRERVFGWPCGPQNVLRRNRPDTEDSSIHFLTCSAQNLSRSQVTRRRCSISGGCVHDPDASGRHLHSRNAHR